MVLTSRKINIRKEFSQGDSSSPVGFCLTEVPISMLIDETNGDTMGRRDEKRVKRTRSLFIDDLKNYQESHRKLMNVVNEMIVKASVDTEACYRVKKFAKIFFRKDEMIKGERLAVLEKNGCIKPEQKQDLQISWVQTGRLNQCKTNYGKSKERNKKIAGPCNRTELE